MPVSQRLYFAIHKPPSLFVFVQPISCLVTFLLFKDILYLNLFLMLPLIKSRSYCFWRHRGTTILLQEISPVRNTLVEELALICLKDTHILTHRMILAMLAGGVSSP